MTWNTQFSSHKSWRDSSQMATLASKLYKGANTSIANLVVEKMEPEEIIERLGDPAVLKDEIKAQVLLAFHKAHKIIDYTTLGADFRTIILCNKPIVSLIRKFDVNADDMTLRQYKHMLGVGHVKLAKHIYNNISDEKLALFDTDAWELLIGRLPGAAKKFDIKTIRNQTELRHFVLRHPYLLGYATVEDMQASVIDGPTWIRIITKMSPSQRGYVPEGFCGWVERDVFKHKLTGRKFKNFAPDWYVGLKDAP